MRLEIRKTGSGNIFRGHFVHGGVPGPERPRHDAADLLILEIGDDTAQDFDTLTRARSTGKAKDFFLTSKNVSPDVLIPALRMGVKEFIPQPINEVELRKA